MDVAALALAGSATALVTGLGVIPVFLLGTRAERLRPFLWGTAIGLMHVASEGPRHRGRPGCAAC